MTGPRRRRRQPQHQPPPPEPPFPPPPAEPTEGPPAAGALASGDGTPGEGGPADGRPGNPERLYTIAGAADGARAELDLVTLIVARSAAPPSASPEGAAVLRLCGAPLSVAELSAYLSLPFSAMTVLITELITAELVQARAPIVRRALPDRSLLEAVMHGLQRL
ncbi:DUF742 domain-containing protein [Streptomyces sp. J2-1]|uniref:DUF742 domain-containing protein n=1 Tax=Streptomyces corallincola TaxID=2851888 RepID=UPI001C37F213|nr:DUF742 domain-containing protein [Streptomyces corallincola]MBV2355839.1 DUF742 domain-containing protein [Streptomyces corallincola]